MRVSCSTTESPRSVKAFLLTSLARRLYEALRFLRVYVNLRAKMFVQCCKVSYMSKWNISYLIYYSLIHSHLHMYMNIIWGTCSKQLLHEFEVIQNRILKIIPGVHFILSVS